MDPNSIKLMCDKYKWASMSDDGLTVMSGAVRLGFVHFEKPYKPKNSKKDERYSCSVIVPEIADWSPLRNAAKTAWATSAAGAGGMQPHKDAIPFKNQAEAKDQRGKHYEGFAQTGSGIWFRTETKEPVPCFGRGGAADVVVPATFYSGVWARLKVRASAYPSIDGGKPGVKFWLQSVQWLADDERFKTSDPGAGFEALAAPPGNGPAAMPGAAPNGAAPPQATGGLW